MEHAEERERQMRESAIEKSARAMAPQFHPEFDGANCVLCDDPLPPLRLTMGKVRCVFCQTQLEKQNAYKS
jgi:RNA polymerase-binding transcription factor DksA